MATSAVSTTSIYQELQQYFGQRKSDLQQLGQALQSGNLATAQQEFNAIQTLGQGGPFANGDAFKVQQRQQDFDAIGQALQSGDLAGAQKAFTQLQATFQRNGGGPQPVFKGGSEPQASSGAGGSQVGPEIVLNLGSLPAGEQITIGVNNAANGTDQVTLSLANPQNSTPQQITLNLNPNSNEELVLNFENGQASNTTGVNGVNLTA